MGDRHLRLWRLGRDVVWEALWRKMTRAAAERRRSRSAQIAAKDVRVITQRRRVKNAAKANRTAYCLSLPIHDKLVHAGELSLNRFVVRFKLDCFLKIYARKTPQDNDDDTCSNIRRKVGLIIGYTPLCASPSFWSAVRACALRKSAFTFLFERPSTVVQSRSASSFLRCVEM